MTLGRLQLFACFSSRLLGGVLGLFVALGVGSCGSLVPRADVPPSSLELNEPPPLPTSHRLLLHDLGASRLSGSVVVWGPRANAQDFADLLSVSQSYAGALVEQRVFVEDRLLPRQRALGQAQEEVEHAYERQRQSLDGSRRKAAGEWFANRLEALTSEHPEARAGGERVFAAYCEALIWKTLLSPEFLTARYRRRPSPSVLCEKAVYGPRGFFEGGACASGDLAGDGRDFLECFWRQGVLRTKFLVHLAPAGPGAEQRAALESVDLDAVRRALLADGTLPRRILRMDGRIDAGGQVLDLRRPRVGSGPGADPLETATPQGVINAVEYENYKVPPLLRLAPDEGSNNLLRRQLSRFSFVNVHLFNQSLQVPPPSGDLGGEVPADVREAFADVFAATDPEAESALAQARSRAAEVDLEVADLKERLDMPAAGCSGDEGLANFACVITELSDQMLGILSRPGVAQAVIPTAQLGVEPDSERPSAFRITLDLGAGGPMLGPAAVARPDEGDLGVAWEVLDAPVPSPGFRLRGSGPAMDLGGEVRRIEARLRLERAGGRLPMVAGDLVFVGPSGLAHAVGAMTLFQAPPGAPN